MVDHGDRLLSICSEMSELSDTLGPHPRAALGVTCIDFAMTIFSMGYRHHREDFAKSSNGHEFILVAIDYFTKWVEAASYARLTSTGVVGFIRSHIIYCYKVPHELISDMGYISEQRLTP